MAENEKKKGLDLNMEITLPFGKKGKKDDKAPKGAKAEKAKKGAVKASKRTMNFVHHKSNFNVMKVLPVVLVIVIALTIFVKVGFLDQLSQKTLAYSQLAMKQEQLALINSRLVGYEELQQQYGRYSYGLMNDTEINLVSRMDVLNLVETKIANKATVENISVNNNVLTMNIFGITLEEASAMVKSLEETDLVTRATVNSATADDGKEARIFISITLTKPVEEAEE